MLFHFIIILIYSIFAFLFVGNWNSLRVSFELLWLQPKT